jgi:hypothetical protein
MRLDFFINGRLIGWSVEPKPPVNKEQIENPRQQWTGQQTPDDPSPEPAAPSLCGFPNEKSAYQADWEVENVKNAIAHSFSFLYRRIISIAGTERVYTGCKWKSRASRRGPSVWRISLATSSHGVCQNASHIYYLDSQKSSYKFKTLGSLSANRKVVLCSLPQTTPIAKRLVTVSLSADGGSSRFAIKRMFIRCVHSFTPHGTASR